jgi:hypothetical protein
LKTTTFTGFQLVLFFVLIISSQGQGTSEQDSIIGKEIGPGIIFPMTPDEIEQEVNTSIFTAHDQITSLLSIPPEQGMRQILSYGLKNFNTH